MATRIWDNATEGDVWVVLPEIGTQDSESEHISSSDTDSTADTTATIQSTEVHSKVEYGRAFPVYEGIPMVLPTDNDEIRRLRIQYFAEKLILGNTLDEIVLAHLSTKGNGKRKSVLDVRTQTGMW
ncbi:hypothetical protein FS749_002214 [Ceratobasidium sp. UAMH 11750]|nr:hypothetical protein FS749_002214 [Ceratobasidium sp. UAMH 11750]